MALDLPLPKQVLTHAHWTIDKAKMSKSVGNVVDPFVAMDHFGTDTMRYYLIRDGGIKDDADYKDAFIYARYKKGLQDGLGNLVSRVLRSKKWNLRNAVRNGKVPPDQTAAILSDAVAALPDTVAKSIDNLDSGDGLRQIMSTIYKVKSSKTEA